jgi:basic membrane protein A
LHTLTKRIGLGAVAALGSIALLTGCGEAPSATSSATTSSYKPCVVGDTGGFTDHSFNQLSLAGVQDAAKAIGASVSKVQSKSSDDYASAIDSLVGLNCNIIVAPGFNFIASVKAAAAKNPDVNFAMIDDNSIKADNVKNLVFETDQAAFLGGYAAAAYSKNGVVATWGGAEFPSVTIFMDGIADGVKYYNEQKKKNVKLLGWNVDTQKGTFIGNFTDQKKAQTVTQNFLDQDADVIIPVAGSLYQGAAAAIQGANSDAVLEGVDADLYQTDPRYKDLILTSILKKVDAASKDVVAAAAKDPKSFDNSQYVGTLENGGLGLAPFHDYESKIPSTLPGELDKIKQGIIDGSIKVDSPASFQ